MLLHGFMSFQDLHFRIVDLITLNDVPISMPLAIKCSIKFSVFELEIAYFKSHYAAVEPEQHFQKECNSHGSHSLVSTIPFYSPFVFPLSAFLAVCFSSFMNSGRAVLVSMQTTNIWLQSKRYFSNVNSKLLFTM